MKFTIAGIKQLIESEVYENNYTYKDWYAGSVKQMLDALDNYLLRGDWAQNICDIAVCAAANCLAVYLCIFKKIDNHALLYFVRSDQPSDRDIYLKYDHEHYDSIVWKGNQPDPVDEKTCEFLRKQGIYFTHDLEKEEQRKKKTFSKPTVEDLGSDNDDDLLKSPMNERASPTAMPANAKFQSHCFTEPASPFKPIPPHEDFEDPAHLEEIPAKYQFEEHYSGAEDAVLNQASGSDSEVDMRSPRKVVDNTSHISSPITVSDATSDSMSSVFSDSSSASMSRNKPRKYSKNKIDRERMARCVVESVEKIPWDINGDHVYEVPATEDNYIQKYQDGRNFSLKNSSRLGLNGIRKTGQCKGTMICLQEDCTKLTSEGVINYSDFKRLGSNNYECNSCGHPVFRIHCGCFKVIEFHRDRGVLQYQHQGEHNCTLKINVAERRKVLDNLPIPLTPGVKVKKHLHDCFRVLLQNDEITRAFELCDEISEADVRDKIKKIRQYPHKSVARKDIAESFIHVAHIQASIKKSKRDKFLLYEWACEELGDKGTYVFKTSVESIRMALKMGGKIKIGMKDSSLNEEPAYFDGMHKRVKNFVSLTLWVFHPGMRSMQILAVMDCPKEDTDNIEIFFDTFNKAMAEYLDEPGYIWDPFLIMMDEKGANFEGITRVFGENFAKAKAVTCQFHFKNCAEKYIVNIPKDKRISFRRLCRQLCRAHTIHEYRSVSKLIVEVAEKYKFLGWWKFWSPRCPHIIPALRGFNLPKMNLAEVGQSTMRGYRPLWLSEAAFSDIAALAFQSSYYKKFIDNKEKITGKGPTLRMKNAKEKAMERQFMIQVDEVLFRGDLEAEGEERIEEAFTPSMRAKHRAPRNLKKSRQGQEDDALDDDVVIIEDPPRKNPKRPGRGQNPKYDQQIVPLNPQIDCDAADNRMVPHATEEKFLTINRPYYVVLNKKNLVSRCRGCQMVITEDEKRPPKNMVFLYKLRRDIPPKDGKGKWQLSREKRNCYFHADDLGCLRQVFELAKVKAADLYMSNENFKKLTNANIEQLERRDHWEPILQNRRSVRLTGDMQ